MTYQTYAKAQHFRTYGEAQYFPLNNTWVITKIEPQAAMALKQIFRRIRKSDVAPFMIKAEPDQCADLLWFMQRYPLVLSPSDQRMLNKQDRHFKQLVTSREMVFQKAPSLPDNIALKGITPYGYQIQAAEFLTVTKRYLLGDTQGLGKTLSAILSLLYANTWPAAIVMDAQLVLQWERVLKTHTDLRVHIIKTTKMYTLPEADVYLFKYSILCGWSDLFAQSHFPFVVYDEIASLRHGTRTEKGNAAKVLSEHAEFVLGLSGTPIYNYGGEIYTIINEFIRPGCLGNEMEFQREWCKSDDVRVIENPQALGAYLREIHVMLRRTRKEVMGSEKLPFVEVHEVDYNESEARTFESLLKKLAISTLGGDKDERFQASGEFSLRLRQLTGIVKAQQVAMYVRMIVESGEPVILCAWHREVYDIYLKALADLKPAMFTGSEDIRQKERNRLAFVNGETNLLILSLRSGIGVDGFQERCAYMVFGELDFSPQIHSQVITRIDRPGQKRDVTILYLICQFGSDPVIQEMLGLKKSQSDGILNPFEDTLQTISSNEAFEGGRIKHLARDYLARHGVSLTIEDKTDNLDEVIISPPSIEVPIEALV